MHLHPMITAKRLLVSFGIVVACACNTSDSGTLVPVLAFSVDADSGLSAARDITVDRNGNVFIFDYDYYLIRKFDSQGTQLAVFGGKGSEPGLFQHLMAIRAAGDSLLALDAGSISVFDLSGEFHSRRSFVDTIICDLPRIHPDGSWAGEWITEETAEKILTRRNPDGGEVDRLGSVALSEFFPGIEPGEMFFINPTQLRSFLYDSDREGRLVWAVSDNLELFLEGGAGAQSLFRKNATAVPYPAEEIAALKARQAASKPPFFLNIPTHYQVIHQLTVDDDRNIWLFVKSEEHTGLLRISPMGGLTGSYQLQAEFDPIFARLAAANGRLYFLAGSREEVRVFVVELP